MKKLHSIYIFSLILFISTACSSDGSDDGSGPDPEENAAPSAVTTLTFPTNNMLCISNTLEFSWSAASDPNGDSVSYIIEISQDDQFLTIDQNLTSNSIFKSVTLEKGIIYYWRVKAKDNKGLESGYSPVFQFYTEGDAIVNHLPFPAQAISPTLGSALNSASTTLSWDASDVDDDPLTYDVYFDTNADPTTKVGDSQNEKTLTVDLNPSTTYYWKVVTKDDNGGQSVGQIWSFSTN